MQPQNPFTWASGWRSPIYCDNRLLLSFPDVRSFVARSLARLIKKEFPETTKIAGVATAGIAHGALIANELNLPFVYVRPEPKKHGRGQQVEGLLLESDKVVLVEDLISTGKSSLKAVDAVRKFPAEVLGVVALFTYSFPEAINNFKLALCPLHTLGNYPKLIEEAHKLEYIKEGEVDLLNDWRKDPANWNQS